MQKYRVALIGLTSLFGKASSLLLKLCPNVYNLRLYDDTDTSTADDLRIINTPCKVEAYQGKTNLNAAIQGSDIVLIGDDILSTPQTCFDVMAPKMLDYAKAISETSPNALIIVAASPINKLVPVLSELLQENGYYDCNRVMGTTASHNIRANCILASYGRADPRTVFLPVVGGDSEDTLVPLFSQSKPHFNISEAVMRRLVEDIKQTSSLIYEMKGSTEALSKAHATIKFLNSVIAGLRGEPNIMNIAFTKTTQVDGTEYFALPVLFGRFGIQARYGIPRILPFEIDLIRDSVLSLQKDTEFAKLFCKSRETAAETCSRNVAIRYKKSKEFEQFVNGLKINKKGNATEDKIVNKIKPPIPVESGELAGDKPFDPRDFCLRHKDDNMGKNGMIPAYMGTGKSIMPVDLHYNLGNDNGIAQFMPKSSSAETPVCQPIVCPDKPKEKKMSYTNIVSLVESLVKKTTEKMLNEKEKDETLKRSFKNVENLNASSEKDKLKESLEKNKNTEVELDKPENSNRCLRKIDMLKLRSHDVEHYQSSSKNVPTTFEKEKLYEKKYSNTFGLMQNNSVTIKDGTTSDRNNIPMEKMNIIENKTNKRKYSEKTLESIFRPSISNNTERFEYKSGITKCNQPEGFEQSETKQQSIIKDRGEISTEMTQQKNEKPTDERYNKFRRLFNTNNKSSRYQNRIVPRIDNCTSDKKNSSHKVINKNILNQIGYRRTLEEENKLKKDQNISIPKPHLGKQTLISVSNNLEKNSSRDVNKKNINAKVDREHFQSVHLHNMEQYNKPDIVENKRIEPLPYRTTKLEDNKYIKNKYKNVFEKRDQVYDKTYNVSDPFIKIKDTKYMKNALLGNLSSSINTENRFYDKIKKKNYELLVGRNLERKTDDVGNLNILSGDKLCTNTKDFVKNKLRNKYLLNKSKNNKFTKGENDRTSQITKTNNVTNSEHKSYADVKSICYNSFSNEVTQINTTSDRCNSHLVSADDKVQNNNIEKKSIVPRTKESIPEPKHDKKQIYISCNENQSSLVHDGKDLNMLMKTLESDVFKYDDKVNTNEITKDEVKLVKGTEDDKYVPEEQKTATVVIASEQDQKTEGSTEIIKSELNEKAFSDLENSQKLCKTENHETTENTIDDVIKEIKLALHSSDQENKSIDMNQQNGQEKSITNILNENDGIKNLTKDPEGKANDGSDSSTFSQSKEVVVLKESSISKKNVSPDSNLEKKESHKNKIDLNNLKNSKKHNNLQNITKRPNKSRKNMNKSQNKSCTQARVSCSTNKSNYISKVTSTIPERFLSIKTTDNSSNKKAGDCVSYIKSLHNSLKAKDNIKKQKKNVKTLKEHLKVSIKNLNDFEVPGESFKQKNVSDKNSLQSNKTIASFTKYSKLFLNSKYYTLIRKKKNTSEMQGLLSGNFGQKVSEINKAEHSFSLRDKNGINNYFLLKGLLPKIKDNQHNLDNQNGSLSLLKTNACNEDPFMSIKDKQRNKTNSANQKNAKPNLKKQTVYTSNGGIRESSSVLITHNSLFSPNCPVHGFKHNLNAKVHQNKSSSPTNKGNMSRINEAMLSNLCRMCNNVRSSEKNSSHQLNQKAHNFKLYSTSALPMKNKSASNLHLEKKKTVKEMLIPKKESTGIKLPKGYIKKQRITRILEKDFKKNNAPRSNKYIHVETKVKETKVFSEMQGCKIKDRTKTQNSCNLHPQIMSKTIKIDENFFNSGFDSSYIGRYLKLPPKYRPHNKILYSTDYKKYSNSPKDRRVADIYKINWSESPNDVQENKFNSLPVENDILVRGTCLDHVRNKFVSNKAAKHELTSDDQKTVLSSMDSAPLSKAFVQYTKDYVEGEYPTNQKLPSIRQLHKCAFHSN